ncbi:MAG: hypothetical protein ACTHJK_14520 [Sphingomicrobium sp.]
MKPLRSDSWTTSVRRPLVTISWPIQLAGIIALSIYLHSAMWWTEPPDVTLFLRPWFQHIIHYGPIGAFAHPFSNYTPAYLYLLAFLSLFHGWMATLFLIKLLSIVGTVFAAFALADLIKATGGQPRYAFLLFILPSAVINTALLAQCDALWAGACLFAVAAMIRGSTVRSLLWCGVAIAFKAQAVFIAPFIIGALIGRRAAWWEWPIPAIVFVATMVPAWLAGWPALQLAMIYPAQSAAYDFPGSLANPWIIGTIWAPDTAKLLYPIGMVGALVASFGIAILSANSVRRPKAMLLLGLLSALTLPFLLPKMHERYFFLADLLSLAAAVSCARRSTIMIAVGVQLASLSSLLTYMYFSSRPYLALLGAAVAAATLFAICRLARKSGVEWPRVGTPRSSAAERLEPGDAKLG